MEAGYEFASPLGRITISSQAVGQIVSQTAAECYGVVGMSGRRLVGRLLARGRERQGIEIGGNDTGVTINLFVVVEYGLNLAQVAATVRSRVAYEVERLTGLTVGAVEVHIQDVRRSG
ncbi:MAG: Asp23/Gls24 family envelope stress response protein [Gaiellaceae bacterium]